MSEGGVYAVLHKKEIPGIKFSSNLKALFLQTIDDWVKLFDIKFALLCGAITSNLGWKETCYVSAPATFEDLFSKIECVAVGELRIYFVPGVSVFNNPLGLPDTMRGEETQVFGFMCITECQTKKTLCLPGTHTKWVEIEGGKIVSVQTSISGELFEILLGASVLVGSDGDGIVSSKLPNQEFLMGIRESTRLSAPRLTHTLFSVRSKQLINTYKGFSASDYLSGLLIGDEVAQVKSHHENVIIIGGIGLTARYAAAFREVGISCQSQDGQLCVLNGLNKVALALIDLENS